MIPVRDLQLLEAYLEGTLSAQQWDELRARLRTEVPLARALVMLSRDEVILTRWAHARRMSLETSAAVLLPLPEVGTPSTPAQGIAETASVGSPAAWPSRFCPSKRWSTRLRLAALAAVLLLAFGLWYFFLPPMGSPPADPGASARSVTKDTPVARVEETHGSVFVVGGSGKVPVLAGQVLLAGQWLETVGADSYAVLRYADHSRLELGTGTLIRMLADPDEDDPEEGDSSPAGPRNNKVFLAEGTITADTTASPDTLPMTLTTPHAEVRGQGVRFSSASAPESTRIDLEADPQRQGHLTLTRKSDGKTIQIRSNSVAVAATEQGPLRAQPLPRRIREPHHVFVEGSGPVLAMDHAPVGPEVVVGGWTGRLTRWNHKTGAVLQQVSTSLKRIQHLAYSPNGRWLVAAGPSRPGSRHKRAYPILLWDSRRGAWLAPLLELRDIRALAFAPDSNTLAVAGMVPEKLKKKTRWNSKVTFWDVSTAKCVGQLPIDARQVRSLAFSPLPLPGISGLLALGSTDGTVQAWKMGESSPRWSVTARAPVLSDEALLSFMGDQKKLAKERKSRRKALAIQALAFSPDGRLLAVGTHGGTVKMRWASSGLICRTLPGPCGEVRSLAFSPRGRYLASASGGTARVWTLDGEQELRINGHRYAVTQVRFTPDGRSLVTSGWDRQAKVWQIQAPPKASGVARVADSRRRRMPFSLLAFRVERALLR